MPNTYSSDGLLDQNKDNLIDFLKIHSVTYGVDFYFLPYAFKITESLNIRWNEQTVFGRMDPIPTYKGMGRTMQIGFQARQKNNISGKPFGKDYDGKELLHDIDHIKKCLYPRYNENKIMVSPPLFRFYYKSFIVAGENTIPKGEKGIADPKAGVLGYITAFSANPATDPNKVYFPSDKKEFAYPKVFDVNFTFTVLNEELTKTQQTGILDDRYFHSYKTDFHGHDKPETSTNITTTAGTKPVNEVQGAVEDAVLGPAPSLFEITSQDPVNQILDQFGVDPNRQWQRSIIFNNN